MASCSISILKVVGLTTASGDLVEINIFGSASFCDEVDVTFRCNGGTSNFSSKVSDHAWSILIPAADFVVRPCPCGSDIEVTAVCVSGGCSDKFTGKLICQNISNCPNVSQTLNDVDSKSDCGPGGTRTFTASITVAPDPSNPVATTVTIDGATVGGHPATTTPYTLNVSASLTPGSHTLAYTLSPGCGSNTTSFTMPNCPPGEGCPKVELQSVKPGDCKAGKRVASVTVLVTPAGGITDAQLIHGSTTLDSQTGMTGPFTLSGTDSFSPAGDSVTVNISTPQGCPPVSLPVKVDPCPGDPPPTGGGPGDSGGDDNGGGSWGCLFGRAAAEVLLASALFLTLVGLCIPGAAPAVLIAAAATAAAGVVAFVLWWLFCGDKCGAILITWQITMIGALVCWFLSTCCPAASLLAIGLGIAALALFVAWLKTCKPSKCRIGLELLWVFAAGAGTIFAYGAKFAPCGLSIVPKIAAAIAAVLTIVSGKECS